MSCTALLVVVPEAEPLVADLRARHDPSAAEGVPAHVTVLVPFVDWDTLRADGLAALEAACAEVPAFDVAFTRVGRFERTAWLAPEPAAPFVALTAAVMARFPGWLPYGGAFGAIVPHLTVADGDAAAADAMAAVLEQRLAAQGPVRARCTAVEVYAGEVGEVGEAAGAGSAAAPPRWRAMHRIPLGRPEASEAAAV